jgi:hypothetical protein
MCPYLCPHVESAEAGGLLIIDFYPWEKPKDSRVDSKINILWNTKS